ncbi:hypothetical protein QBC39DRAFT_186000 [Podospora conica]|nr:hypothetical protein QBC39DRAFT_186000 [Schizothecium conicum]
MWTHKHSTHSGTWSGLVWSVCSGRTGPIQQENHFCCFGFFNPHAACAAGAIPSALPARQPAAAWTGLVWSGLAMCSICVCFCFSSRSVLFLFLFLSRCRLCQREEKRGRSAPGCWLVGFALAYRSAAQRSAAHEACIVSLFACVLHEPGAFPFPAGSQSRSEGRRGRGRDAIHPWWERCKSHWRSRGRGVLDERHDGNDTTSPIPCTVELQRRRCASHASLQAGRPVCCSSSFLF